MSGKLFVGNLGDISFRAVEYLKMVDLVLAEDTRTAGQLLKHLSIEKRLMSHHQHNEHHSSTEVVRLISEGKNIALLSDAGTPGISDPGFLLTRACIQANIQVECLPGATAFVPALVCSGLANDRFHFEGFLPQKKGRQSRLLWLAEYPFTVVLYESPHRIEKLIAEIVEYFGPYRSICISREISKKFGEHIRGKASEIMADIPNLTLKGEMVVCIDGNAQHLKKKNQHDEEK
jgi:16S rRNA (cytidine1402-2'-O)-methyltransferase